MANRTIYVLRDSVTGLYYCSASNDLYGHDVKGIPKAPDPQDPYKQFDRAVIHTTEKSVISGQKNRIAMFKRDLAISDEDVKSYSWRKIPRIVAREREKLPKFGIEIIALEISDGIKK